MLESFLKRCLIGIVIFHISLGSVTLIAPRGTFLAYWNIYEFFSEAYGLLLIALPYALGITLVSVMIYFATSYFENKKQKERE